MKSKSILFAALMVWLTAAPVFAAPITLLSAAAATGPGTAVMPLKAYATWSCDATITGAPTAVTVRIEGTQGGTTFDPTGMATQTCTAGQLTAGICSFSFIGMPVNLIRANLITLTGGTTPTVTVICTGAQP
jgi:hypothetical protein